MKKLIALVLALVCVLGLVGCNSKKDVPFDETGAFFVGKVVEINETTMLVEVTYKGNCGVSEGNQVYVSTEKMAGILNSDPEIVTDNYVRIEFDGSIMETYPLQLGDIYKIDVTDAEGIPIE